MTLALTSVAVGAVVAVTERREGAAMSETEITEPLSAARSFAPDGVRYVKLGQGGAWSAAAFHEVISPLLSGPKSLLFWVMKEFGNGQEA
ncbi:MAG: hypothetical protein H7243_10780 [Sphingomonadaceae bacterium]|nr:hypothetical protein [Sphingomonadaceae bacterium]